MTPAELLKLTTELVGEVTLEDLRRGRTVLGEGLSDEAFPILVRLLAGETVVDPTDPGQWERNEQPLPRFLVNELAAPSPIPPEIEHEDENPPDKIDLGGVTLLG